ncbi:MFS transporter [Cupriavidus sp. UME77]|uniref:MFS transporter n=1 Tax=Cupriavidus sp. UME77 TaxID=1862321 RepID=UPI001604599D|nr:MFS transporter [Cupriavidus sp. UME77]MBB1634862.1 MFS transporter [Cupriavidus sp. UME77]
MSCPASTSNTAPPGIAPGMPELTGTLTLCFAAAVGVMVINLFAAQPLTGPISAALGLPPAWRGLVAMLPQLGYATGLLLLVPLADLLENRRLVAGTLLMCAAMLALAAMAWSGVVFFLAVFAAGVGSCAIQMLVPLAALMAPQARRGRAVGNVMSGLMLGILLSRPLASLLAGSGGWRACYAVLAGLDALLAAVLLRWLPSRRPDSGHRYASLIASMWQLLRSQPVLRRHALTAALSMAAFSAFWTAVGLRLAQPPFALGSHGVALFALAGAAGAVAAPVAGRLGDQGHGRFGTVVSQLCVLASLLLAGAAAGGWFSFAPEAHRTLAIGLLVMAAMVLDAGVTADQTFGRREINLLDAAARGRLNGLFVGIFFVGGATGALAGGAAWAVGGWQGVCLAGIGFAALNLVAHGFMLRSRAVPMAAQ